jgi:FkbH-like protein
VTKPTPKPRAEISLATLFAALDEGLLRPLGTAALLVWLARHSIFYKRDALFWVMVSPAIYFLWLTTHLAFCALETRFLRRFFRKPHRYEEGVSPRREGIALLITLRLYIRTAFIQSLPLTSFFVRFPGLRWLVFRATATHFHCHRTALLVPGVIDPDLTFIGSHVILGEGTRLVAHNAARTADGRMIFQTAPIRLGNESVIGGDTLVELGVTVGARSIVESFSHVLAYTQIPPGQVWGGNPAVFHYLRDAAAAEIIPAEKKFPSDTLALIARALEVPAEKISATSSPTNVREWDSLGKMAIGAAIHSQHGVQLTPTQTFALNSVAAVAAAIENIPPTPKTPAATANPELLPLLDPAAATAHLASQPSQLPSPISHLQVCIAATFVAQPLADALKLWTRAFGLDVEIQFADFNQIPQTLLAPDSLFAKNKSGINVVLARPEDLPGGKIAAEPILSALKTFAAHTTSQLVVADLPPELFPRLEFRLQAVPEPPKGGTPYTTWWREQLAAIPRVEILPFAEIIAELGHAAARDSQMANAASTPYTPAVYQRLGIALARVVRASRVAPKKLIVVDCDGTLWRGVVGEDGAAGVTVDAPFRALQTALRELRQHGVLLALASKNLPDDVWRVFAEHKEMILRREDFVGAKINWQPKSENLRALAAELNLGLDACVFLDDNEAERLEVAAHCPGVTVLPGDAAHFATALAKLWLFDGAGATSEDESRSEFMQHDAARQQARGTADLETYLRSLELVVEIRRAQAYDLPRVSQLSLKTNQFNTTLHRRSLAEIQTLAATHEVWTISARDKFGDYGLIGGVVGSSSAVGYTLDALFVSCRALGRGVEEALLHTLARHARDGGAKILRAPFVDGSRNEPAKNFLRRAGFCETSGGIFELPLTELPPLPGHVRLNP